MKTLTTILISICLFPWSGFCFSDREIFDLLSQKSKTINQFPFHVFIAHEEQTFEGVALPVSCYDFFQPFYYELQFKQPDEIFATYQFSEGKRYQCFLLRVPNAYGGVIDIWTFDREQNVWQKPMEIAKNWGDAGKVVEVHAWLDDLDKDGDLDIVEREFEDASFMEDAPLDQSMKKTTHLLFWEKDHFEDKTSYSMRRDFDIDLSKYRVKEWNDNLSWWKE